MSAPSLRTRRRALVLPVLLVLLCLPLVLRPPLVHARPLRDQLVGTPAERGPRPPVPPTLPPTVTPTREPASTTGGWPLDPRPEVVARFDPPQSRWGAGHRGVDLLGRVGQRVLAAQAGRVTFAGTLAGRGVVVVDHGTTRTTYEPVDASVSRGDQVTAGQVIGRLQTGGSHCFPRTCLHWGLIEGDGAAEHYLDPLTLVGLGPLRLLPLPVE